MFIFAFGAILVVFLHTGSSEVVERSALFYTKENLKVDVGTLIKRRTTRSLASCTQECLSEPWCASFNYDGKASQGVCELYEEGDDMQLTQEQGWLCGHLLERTSFEEKIVKHLKFAFTTLDGKGPTGPTDASGYQGTTLHGKVSLDNGIQLWQVPVNGSYVIEAWGASGAQGRRKKGERPGGKGAYMKGTFNLTRGTLLKILVGQAGSHGTVGLPLPGGGGGGTFITSSSNAALIVAGGGGGGGAAPGNNHDGDPGQIVEEGSRSGGSNGNGGTILRNGSPSDSFEGGAGGGLVGDGESAILAKGGKSFVKGGEGGDSRNGGKGGYGGGGGGVQFPGAGGGYSGGGIMEKSGKTIAGGGGSFNNGGNPVKKEGVKEGDGKVIITPEDPEL